MTLNLNLSAIVSEQSVVLHHSLLKRKASPGHRPEQVSFLVQQRRQRRVGPRKKPIDVLFSLCRFEKNQKRMKIFRSLSEIPADYGPTVATIGNFDGVHRGHQWVIEEVVSRARELGIPSIAITFDPHPARVLRPDSVR